MSDVSQGGGSSSDAQAATVAALSSNDQATNGEGQAQGQPSQGVQGLAEGFLNRVDPAHRPIVEPYVKQWDAGVTRRFQELHGQLSPYQELGDPESLATAKQLMEMIDTDPQQVLQILQEAIGEVDGQQGQETEPAAGELEGDSPGIPPELKQQIDTLQNVVEAIAQQMLDQKSSVEQQQEDQELDEYMTLLKNEFGEFDEDFVIAKMLAGMDGEAAVQAYMSAIQSQVNQRAARPNVPPILSGGGAVPQEGQRISQAPRKEVKNLVANILAQAQQG